MIDITNSQLDFTTYRKAVLELGASAYFPLNETSGITAYDVVATNNGEYLPNSGGTWTGGILNADGANFNGSSGRVEFGDILNPENDNYSINFFYEHNSGSTQFLISKGNHFSAIEGFSIFISGGLIGTRVNDGTNRSGTDLTPTNGLRMCTVVIDRTNSILRIYLDADDTGASNGSSGAPTRSLVGMGSISTSTYPLIIGMGSFNYPLVYEPFNGLIKGVGIFKGTALNQEQIDYLYNTGIK